MKPTTDQLEYVTCSMEPLIPESALQNVGRTFQFPHLGPMPIGESWLKIAPTIRWETLSFRVETRYVRGKWDPAIYAPFPAPGNEVEELTYFKLLHPWLTTFLRVDPERLFTCIELPIEMHPQFSKLMAKYAPEEWAKRVPQPMPPLIATTVAEELPVQPELKPLLPPAAQRVQPPTE